MDKNAGLDQAPTGAHPEPHPLYAPGLKWRSRAGGDIPMWIPPGRDIKNGYLPKSLMLDRTATPLEIAEACRRQWKDLADWRTGKPKPVRYTINWLIGRYKTDPTSPYHGLGHDTQLSYGWEMDLIAKTVGERRLDPKKEGGVETPRITGEDFRRWFHNWGHPASKDPAPSRATHCMAMFRGLISYYVEIGGPGSVQLRAMLSAMRFKKSAARDVAPTYEQVDAIVNKAEETGYRSIAITTLAQYELIERRGHIIGKWIGDEWGDGWVWEGVTAEWVISYYQTKKGLRLREYDLKPVQRLLGLMQVTPKEQRQGPIILCEDTGEPWGKRRYQEAFREIARAAGVPDEILSMDMRSGGATEADDVEEITDRMFDDAGGWTDPNMKHRYRRNKQRNANKVLVFRQEMRKKTPCG